jgi:membrane protease YdiL (CAAX protease family)
MIANIAISSLLQVGVVFALCALIWAMFGRSKASFGSYYGLFGAPAKVLVAATLIGGIVAFLILVPDAMRSMAGGEKSVVAQVRDIAPTGQLGAIAMLAIFKTALSEELFFRGLLGRRLIARFGFAVGNAVQAIAFGAIHLLVLISPQATAPLAAALVIGTGIGGWLSGWANERLAGGSILPGWAAHAAANFVAYTILADLI